MSVPEIKATARVTVQVEVWCTQPWGKGATLEEIHQTASREALSTLQRLLDGNKTREVRILGEPKVTAVLAEATP